MPPWQSSGSLVHSSTSGHVKRQQADDADPDRMIQEAPLCGTSFIITLFASGHTHPSTSHPSQGFACVLLASVPSPYNHTRCASSHVACVWRSQQTTCGSSFSPCMIPETKLRSLRLASGSFTHRAVFLTPTSQPLLSSFYPIDSHSPRPPSQPHRAGTSPGMYIPTGPHSNFVFLGNVFKTSSLRVYSQLQPPFLLHPTLCLF